MRVIISVRESSDPDLEATSYSINFSEQRDAHGLYKAKLLSDENQFVHMVEKSTIEEVGDELRNFFTKRGAKILLYKDVVPDDDTRRIIELLKANE